MTNKLDEAVDELREELAILELDVLTSYTLADAIREGSTVTTQAFGTYTNADGQACALTAAYVAAKARGYIV